MNIKFKLRTTNIQRLNLLWTPLEAENKMSSSSVIYPILLIASAKCIQYRKWVELKMELCSATNDVKAQHEQIFCQSKMISQRLWHEVENKKLPKSKGACYFASLVEVKDDTRSLLSSFCATQLSKEDKDFIILITSQMCSLKCDLHSTPVK